MSATPKSIRAKIKAILDSLTTFGYVADYYDPNPSGFPSATFDITNHDSQFTTNKENLRSITYTVLIQQEITTVGISVAKRIVDERVEEVINAFANDFSLGGEVEWCTPLEGARGQADSPTGSVFYQQLNLNCQFTYLTS